MTAQAMDQIVYKGEEYSLASEPLYPYLGTRNDIRFYGFSTDNSRGYTATWELLDDQLFLIGLSGTMFLNDGSDAENAITDAIRVSSINKLFPDSGDKVLANWYTGDIRIPQGKVLQYVHMGYGSLYEKDLIIQLVEGKVVNQKELDYRDKYSKLSDTEKRKLGQDLKFRS